MQSVRLLINALLEETSRNLHCQGRQRLGFSERIVSQLWYGREVDNNPLRGEDTCCLFPPND